MPRRVRSLVLRFLHRLRLFFLDPLLEQLAAIREELVRERTSREQALEAVLAQQREMLAKLSARIDQGQQVVQEQLQAAIEQPQQALLRRIDTLAPCLEQIRDAIVRRQDTVLEALQRETSRQEADRERWKALLHSATELVRGAGSKSELGALAQSSPGAWFLAQESARLEFLRAYGDLTRTTSEVGALQCAAMFLKLHFTSAVVQSLLNEQVIERAVHSDSRCLG